MSRAPSAPSIILAVAGSLALACEMTACGGAVATASPIDADAALAADAADAADGRVEEANGSADPSTPSRWQDEPSTLHPEHGDCLDRPIGECENAFGRPFAEELETCNPDDRVCGSLLYTTDANGCVSAIGLPPNGRLSSEKREVQRCLAEVMSKKRFPCATNEDSSLALNSCTLAK